MQVIDVRHVSKQFRLRHNASVELKVRFLGLMHRHHRQSIEEFWALNDVSLRIDQGEAVALVGRNGSGKSTFLKLVAAIHRPTSGRLLVARGARICSMIELGVGFHPELTGRENVFLNAAIHGLTSRETEDIYQRIVDFSGLDHFIDVPIKNYSSGMYMRLGFSIAANLDPDILLLDEIFAVGDADFQQRCVETLKGFLAQGKTILFVSHSPQAVRTICRRTCVLDQGRLAFDGDVESGLAFYDRLLTRGSKVVRSRAPETPGAGPALAGEPHDPPWLLERLRQEGLEPHHRVLHVAGADRLGDEWHAFLDEGNYFRLHDVAALMAIDPIQPFDFVVAESMWASVPFNTVARSIASAVRKLQPSGRFYATWFENPDAANFEPIVRANDVITYPDHEPFHYPLSLVANVCDAVGATVRRVAAPGRDESVMAIARGGDRSA